MKDARDAVRNRISQIKSFLAQEQPPRLSESDTKANFIEPIIAALGWEGIGVVTREYYVRNSQEFIDYVMRGPGGPLLAIEAKPLQTDLTDKHAAQLIQYCAVEGIEWAALTNGRELQFFNTFLKPDLAAKRVLRLDLLAFNTDEEFAALFGQIWQLSRESMTEPKGVRTWLNQRRLDSALRTALLDPNSPTIRYLRRILSNQDISASSQDLAQWFRSHLGAPITTIPMPKRQAVDLAQPTSRIDQVEKPTSAEILGRSGSRRTSEEATRVTGAREGTLGLFATLRNVVEQRIPSVNWRVTKHYVAADEGGRTFLAVKFRSEYLLLGLSLHPDQESTRLRDNSREFKWARMTKVATIRDRTAIDDELLVLINEARSHAVSARGSNSYYGVTLEHLMDAGLLSPGTPLALIGAGQGVVTTAALTDTGEIHWQGQSYRALSDRTFCQLLGRRSMNGWMHWYADLPQGRESLFAVRERYRAMVASRDGGPNRNSG